MSPSPFQRRSPGQRGYSLVELMVALTIGAIVLAGTMGVFIAGMRAMYRDSKRLETNASLRYFIAQVSKETLDSTEFYVFPTYESLDGSVNLTDDVSALEADAYGTYLAYGDCLVLATRVAASDETSNVRQFRIYYRVRKPNESAAAIAPLRYYESTDYGTTGTNTSLTALVNAVNLKQSPLISGSRQIVARARGRPVNGSETDCYPIFSTESATASPTNDSVSINVEVIDGNAATHMLSSSSFNYTISPRK